LVKRIGKKLIDASGVPELQNLEWEFVVIESKTTVNAFALPGGKICVFTGIFPVAKDEVGLATVLAHEIGHVYASESPLSLLSHTPPSLLNHIPSFQDMVQRNWPSDL
jgi:predicted Zn-dependent protease